MIVSVGGVREPKALRGGGIVARSSASGGERKEISIDNSGDRYVGMVKSCLGDVTYNVMEGHR